MLKVIVIKYNSLSLRMFNLKQGKMENTQLTKPIVKKGYLGIKYLYIDEKTRVRYGFSLFHVGIVYKLQRKSFWWYDVAWTYPSTHIGQNLEEIISYLKWYEKDKTKCLF
jgi:hypothetical protein